MLDGMLLIDGLVDRDGVTLGASVGQNSGVEAMTAVLLVHAFSALHVQSPIRLLLFWHA